jgi:transcription antitermination factor NusA-like protein
MINTIDMNDLRHLNLFSKITHIDTRFFFTYNETLFFCVPKKLVSKAIGIGARNIKRLNEILRKKIRILPNPSGVEEAKEFIEAIVSPVEFKELKINENEIILTAGSQSKAALIGRNKRRLLEMQKIVSDYFRKDFRII